MARTIPWLKQQAKPAKATACQRPLKRLKIDDLMSDEDLDSTSEISGRKVQIKGGRSPSTSPPPAPPLEEFMYEGLDRDDIFIMVEDEFQAVAQTFTKHLHHAEYVRLKNKAKQHSSSTSTAICRPVDSRTVISEETKKELQSEARSAKNKAALEQIAGSGMPDLGSDEYEMEATKDDDPWAGTSLQGLMTSPSRKQTSLTGLDGLKSSTRAAAGFSQPENQTSVRNVFKLGKLAPRSRAMANSSKEPPVNYAETSSDDDDLDAPAFRQKPAAKTVSVSTHEVATIGLDYTRVAQYPSVPQESVASNPKPVRNAHRRSGDRKENDERLNTARHHGTLSKIDEFDDFPQPSVRLHGEGKQLIRGRARFNGKELGKKPEKPGRSFDEIPIFLV